MTDSGHRQVGGGHDPTPMSAAYPPAQGCDAQLDAFCADMCEYRPSFARLDDDAHPLPS